MNRLFAALQFDDEPSADIGSLRQFELGNPLPFSFVGDKRT